MQISTMNEIKQAVNDLLASYDAAGSYECKVVFKEKPNSEFEARKAAAIQSIVCEALNVPVSDVLRKTNKRNIVNARFFISKLLKTYCLLTLQQMSWFAGYKGDHTGLLNGERTLTDLISVYDDVAEQYRSIELLVVNCEIVQHEAA